MYVRAGRPAFAWPCVGIHKSTSLMSSSLLLQQCPACLVRLTWIVFVIGGRWPYSWCLVGCCCQDFKSLTTPNIYIFRTFIFIYIGPVTWDCRINRLHLCREGNLPQWVSWWLSWLELHNTPTASLQKGRTSLTSFLDMTLNNLMLMLQWYWSFGECRVPLHCNRSQVHSGLEW